jgi:hypothetical protein
MQRAALLESALLVQCAPSQAAQAAELANRAGGGLVISGQAALTKADELKRQGLPVLCDAQRYTGAKRALADADFSHQWLACQRDLGGPVLTDSGYVGKHDVAGLRSILRRTLRLGENAFALLPLHADWLKESPDRDVLLDEVTATGVPIAVALEHQSDPLGVQQVLRGLLMLLATDVPVILLRSDVSAIGALCHGAHAAAIGTTTALRHIYPMPKPGAGGGGRRASVAAFEPHFLNYVTVDKLAGAVQRTPENNLWTCECTACGGRAVDHFATIRDETSRQDYAFRHSIELLYLLREEFFTVDVDRKVAWDARCDAAICHHLDVRAELPDWRTPTFLAAWRKVWASRQASTPSSMSRS